MNRSPPCDIEGSDDEDIRRAQEIALAVARNPKITISEARKKFGAGGSVVCARSPSALSTSSSQSPSPLTGSLHAPLSAPPSLHGDSGLGPSALALPPPRESHHQLSQSRCRSTNRKPPMSTLPTSQSSTSDLLDKRTGTISTRCQSGDRSFANGTFDVEDEEVRRAREMALAVAALGTEAPSLTPKEIRDRAAAQAEKVMEAEREAAEKEREEMDKLKAEAERVARETMALEEKSRKDEVVTMGIADVLASGGVEGIIVAVKGFLSKPWTLRGTYLYMTFVLFNSAMVYLAVYPSVQNFWNAAVVVNVTAAMCLTQETVAADSNGRDVPTADQPLSEESRGGAEAPAHALEAEEPDRPEEKIHPSLVFPESDLQSLHELQPDSTLAERRRFLKARKGVIKAASAQLGSYLQWRETNRIVEFFPATFTTDEEDWSLAARGALEIGNTSRMPLERCSLPRLVSVFGEGGSQQVTCRNGARVVHVLPSLLDSSLASASTYALAVAMYLDRKIDRNFTEKVTVVIDIRSGKGWPNPSSVSIVPFIKLVVGTLNSYFPERLSRCILFPLPRTATMLFNKAKAYLDPDTAAKIQICAGSGSVASSVPEKVGLFIDGDAIQAMEKRRLSFFRQ